MISNPPSSHPYGHLLLSNVFSDRSFGFSTFCLTLQDVIEAQAKIQRSCRSAYVTFTSSKSFSPIWHFLRLLTSLSLVILSPWTLGTDGEGWILVPLSPLTYLGHRLTSALTSRPSALTKSQLRLRLSAVANNLKSHGFCLWTKCPLESKPGCLYGGRHLFWEMMSKYQSSQDTPTTLIRNRFMNKTCAESRIFWNICLNQQIIY